MLPFGLADSTAVKVAPGKSICVNCFGSGESRSECGAGPPTERATGMLMPARPRFAKPWRLDNCGADSPWPQTRELVAVKAAIVIAIPFVNCILILLLLVEFSFHCFTR